MQPDYTVEWTATLGRIIFQRMVAAATCHSAQGSNSMIEKQSLGIFNRLFWTLAIGMSLMNPSFAAEPTSDETKVVDAMRSMYVAATNDDLARFHTVAAADFYSFDNGKRFTGDALMELIKKAHAAGKVYVWEVTEPEVHIDGATAWITYVNKGSLQDPSGTKNLSWLESAVLRKEKGIWQIHFFHSTRVLQE